MAKKPLPILDLNAFVFDQNTVSDKALAERIKLRYKTQGPSSMLFYQEPLHIVRGQGTWLYDSKGTKYLDVYNNVACLGHCHPKVVEAVSQQLSQLNVHSRYLHDTVHVYAEKLLTTLPDNIDRLVMTCTGSESNDLALRLARIHTQKKGIIVSEVAYHGNTQMVTEVSPASFKMQMPPEYVLTVSVAEVTYRGDRAADWLADQVYSAIQTLDERGFGCAALLVDPIFSSDGIYSDPPGFLNKAVELVHDHGGLFIADEVQSGFARTGDSMWGFQRHNVVPDIITMGKPMGNGYPVAGVASRLDLLEALCQEAGYFNTFGGSTTAAAAGLAVLNVLEEEGMLENSRQVGAYLKRGLHELQDQYHCIEEIRGAGLYIGVEFSEDGDINRPDVDMATATINLLRRDQVLVGTVGKYGNVLKIRPPLCFTQDNADLFLDKMSKVLKELG
jgi:4-aminobutyrate aminotransferase-like enzyme